MSCKKTGNTQMAGLSLRRGHHLVQSSFQYKIWRKASFSSVLEAPLISATLELRFVIPCAELRCLLIIFLMISQKKLQMNLELGRVQFWVWRSCRRRGSFLSSLSSLSSSPSSLSISSQPSPWSLTKGAKKGAASSQLYLHYHKCLQVIAAVLSF